MTCVFTICTYFAFYLSPVPSAFRLCVCYSPDLSLCLPSPASACWALIKVNCLNFHHYRWATLMSPPQPELWHPALIHIYEHWTIYCALSSLYCIFSLYFLLCLLYLYIFVILIYGVALLFLPYLVSCFCCCNTIFMYLELMKCYIIWNNST